LTTTDVLKTINSWPTTAGQRVNRVALITQNQLNDCTVNSMFATSYWLVVLQLAFISYCIVWILS